MHFFHFLISFTAGFDIIQRTDIVYAESFGTIETTSPYKSNQYIHYHIFATQVRWNLKEKFKFLFLKMIEVRFTRFQLENKKQGQCSDYVQLKYRDIVTEKNNFAHKARFRNVLKH